MSWLRDNATKRTSVAAVVALVLVGCGSNHSTIRRASGQPVSIVATAYPLVWLAESIGGPNVRVTNIVPVGVEPHDVELTPDSVESFLGADLAILVGGGFQPGPEKLAKQRTGTTINAIALVDPGDKLSDDRHFWLDPIAFDAVRVALLHQLINVAPEYEGQFTKRAEKIRDQLVSLESTLRTQLRDCKTKTLITSHTAYSYLTRILSWKQQSLSGSSPNAEPDPELLGRLAATVRRENVDTVYADDLGSSKATETLARESESTVRVLHTIEGLTERQQHDGESYLSLMKENVATLVAGQNCLSQ